MRSIYLSAICLVSLTHAGWALANDTPQVAPTLQPNPQVDYAGFTALTQELQEYRSKRLITMDQFINLYGYGYQNIYELNDVVLMSDPRLEWTRLSL